MIQANELRIGNLVGVARTAIYANGWDSCNYLFEIEEIRNESVHFKGFSYGEFLNNLNPIPLTEEWLVKFGFEKIIHSIKGTELKDEYEKGFVRISHYMGQFDFHGSTKLKYVHQLQNLYFALTGEELKLTQ